MQHAILEQYLPAKSVHTDINELLRCRYLSESLQLKSLEAHGSLSGSHRSRDFGRGLEFEELRIYQPGDDIRSIDWKVTARTGKTHTRLYSEDRELPVLCIVDQRPTMFFGSQDCMKSVMACHLAALLTWGTVNSGDRIGGCIFNGETIEHFPAKRNRKAVMSFLDRLCRVNQQLSLDSHTGKMPLDEVINKVLQLKQHGTRIYIISDFHDGFDSLEIALNRLAHKNRISLLQVNDPLEIKQMLPESTVFSDGDRFFKANQKHLENLVKENNQNTKKLKQWSYERGMHYQQVILGDSPGQWLGGLT